MKRITLRSQILEVAQTWKQQYCGETPTDKMQILKKLENINLETATCKDIENIIGNDTWACQQLCDECNKYFNIIIQVGEKPDYESQTACLCISCLTKALDLAITQKEK